ncbi:MAG TPA: TIGR03067 domain-containing protein [Patescibacteria group bacterium]|nr:TIGR03067 domain-containing protein [Patescibacteria group bacterium]
MDDELERLQGAWNVIFLEVDGMTPAPNVYAGSTIEVKGDRFTTRAMGAVYSGTLELDAEKVPNQMRMKFTDGPEKGNTNNGIYELEGDRWRFCLNLKGGPAPTEFATSPGSGRALETLNRDKRE